MTEPFDPKDVLYLDVALTRLGEKMETSMLRAKKALPGTRGGIILPLQEATVLLSGVRELVERSGLSKRLGFIITSDGKIQPVITKDPDTIVNEAKADPVV